MSARSTKSRTRRSTHDAPNNSKIQEHEIEQIEERSSPRTPVIYEIVSRMGEEEMSRPLTSLWWSGVAAGLSLSFSLLAQAILVLHLPDTSWRPLVASFGYSVGFVMVVLARQQLFTENTITAVLPVVVELSARNFVKLGRLWAVVLVANIVGTLFAAVFCNYTPVVPPELRAAMIDISRDLMTHGWIEIFFRAISAGFLIATMVWLIPSAGNAQFYVVVLLTYLIAVGGFAHIIAGSVEAFLLVLNGLLPWWLMVLQFFIPALIGNIIGGTALFALIAYGQVAKEI